MFATQVRWELTKIGSKICIMLKEVNDSKIFKM